MSKSVSASNPEFEELCVDLEGALDELQGTIEELFEAIEGDEEDLSSSKRWEAIPSRNLFSELGATLGRVLSLQAELVHLTSLLALAPSTK